jgi:hypothetical protein
MASFVHSGQISFTPFDVTPRSRGRRRRGHDGPRRRRSERPAMLPDRGLDIQRRLQRLVVGFQFRSSMQVSLQTVLCTFRSNAALTERVGFACIRC